VHQNLSHTLRDIIGFSIGVHTSDSTYTEGILVQVENDYLVIRNDYDEDMFFNLEEIQAITKNTKHFQAKKIEAGKLNAAKLSNLLAEYKYEWVTINCKNNLSFSGILSAISDEYVVLLVQEESLFIQKSHITNFHKQLTENETEQESNDRQEDSNGENEIDSTTDSNETKTKVETETKVEPETKVEVETKAEPETKVEVETKAEPETKTEEKTKTAIAGTSKKEKLTEKDSSTKLHSEIVAEIEGSTPTKTKKEMTTKNEIPIQKEKKENNAVKGIKNVTESSTPKENDNKIEMEKCATTTPKIKTTSETKANKVPTNDTKQNKAKQSSKTKQKNNISNSLADEIKSILSVYIKPVEATATNIVNSKKENKTTATKSSNRRRG
jgi:small nuclear ribonucleoprotein (snRNP)-like protein